MDEKKVQEAVASMLADSSQRDALAELIVEFVEPNHLTTEFISDILDSRALKPGDSLVKKIRRGIEVRTLVPGSIALASEITVEERIAYVLDTAVVKVTYNEWELLAGDIGTVQSIRAEMAARLREHFVNRLYTAISTVWTAGNTPNNFVSVGGAVTATALEDAIDQINLRGKAKVVLGSRTAMTPISKFGAFWDNAAGDTVGSQNAIDEVRQSGFLGRYYGVPLMIVEQVYDNPVDNVALVPEDFILVIGEKAGSFITYGPTNSSQWSDPAVIPPQWFLQLWTQWGLLIDNAEKIYVIGGLS